MKRINLKSISEHLSSAEMKLIGGGNKLPSTTKGYCCDGPPNNQCDPIFICYKDSDCSAWGSKAYCNN